VVKKAKSNFDPKVFLATVDGGRTVSDYRKDAVIFSQGDPADAVFYIQKGKVRIAVTSEQGKEAVVAILGAGAFFGEGCLIGQPLRLANASALTESAVMPLKKAEMTRILHAEPFNSSEKRLARTLLLLANYGKESTAEPVTTRISQETLAEIVGTTRSRVNQFMNKFRKLGFIEYNGHLRIHSSLLTVLLRD